MSIMARIRERTVTDRGVVVATRSPDQKKEHAFNELKAKIHYRLLNLLDLTRLAEAEESALTEDLRRGIDIILAEHGLALTLPEKERLCKEIRDELLGYTFATTGARRPAQLQSTAGIWYKAPIMHSNRLTILAGASLVALLALFALPAAALAGGVYFVKQGDTLARIGRVFGVGVDAIRAANPLAGDRIMPGDRLRIPDAAASPPAKAPTTEVEPAPRHAVDPGRVRQALCREETVYHAVAKGETLTAIARRYQTSVEELRHLNKLSARARLSIGQRILVRRSGPRTHVVARGETLRRRPVSPF